MVKEAYESKLLEGLHQMIKDMQRIKFICQRAQRFDMDEKDIKEILELTKKHV